FISNFILGLIIYVISLRKYHVQSTSDNVNESLLYSKHLSAIGIFSQLSSQVDPLLLWHTASPVQLAIYSFAQAPIRELRNLTENFLSLIFPKFSTKTIDEVKKTLPLRIFQMTVVSCIMAGAYIISAPFIFRTFLPQYIDSVFWSQLIAITLIFQSKGLIETLIIAHGKIKLRYIAIITNHSIRIILFLILIPLYGIQGAIIGTLISEFVSAIIFAVIYKKL
ncbi:polysaccharide biosynthesis C-terminal domain-containing protein, partial [Patescibacteria group bacterium]|nr:polysaccharide biosynthesis C-terminal domain-containing protein [Patescibacteria group bacterium]